MKPQLWRVAADSHRFDFLAGSQPSTPPEPPSDLVGMVELIDSRWEPARPEVVEAYLRGQDPYPPKRVTVIGTAGSAVYVSMSVMCEDGSEINLNDMTQRLEEYITRPQTVWNWALEEDYAPPPPPPVKKSKPAKLSRSLTEKQQMVLDSLPESGEWVRPGHIKLMFSDKDVPGAVVSFYLRRLEEAGKIESNGLPTGARWVRLMTPNRPEPPQTIKALEDKLSADLKKNHPLRVLMASEDYQPMTICQLHHAVQMPESSVRGWLFSQLAQGKVQREKDGRSYRYSLVQ